MNADDKLATNEMSLDTDMIEGDVANSHSASGTVSTKSDREFDHDVDEAIAV
jgi:hypothetical protein